MHIKTEAQKVVAGDTYFAIRGTQKDGHDFIPLAIEKGASTIVIEDPEVLKKYPNAVLVKSSRQALAKAASEYFKNPTEQFNLVGITGTNGKTTTTTLLKNLWDLLGLKAGLIGTIKTEILQVEHPSKLTTPGPIELQSLFSEMVSREVSHVAMEVSSIGLHQERVFSSHFHTAAFTNLTQDHLDYHKDMESYFLEKLKLFTDYAPKNIVINSRDIYGKRILDLSPCKNKFRFSLQPADFFPLKYELSARGIKADIQTPSKNYSFESPMIGAHNLENLLAVITICYALEISLEKVIEKLSQLKMPAGRLQKIVSAPHVFVDYAHSDDALKNVLECLQNIKKPDQRIWTVFGCGGDRDSDKRPKMGKVASELSDFVMVTSDNPRNEDPQKIIEDILAGLTNKNYAHEVDRKKAIETVLGHADEKDIVLIAGKGHENYQIIGETKYVFDDSAVIKEYYER